MYRYIRILKGDYKNMAATSLLVGRLGVYRGCCREISKPIWLVGKSVGRSYERNTKAPQEHVERRKQIISDLRRSENNYVCTLHIGDNNV